MDDKPEVYIGKFFAYHQHVRLPGFVGGLPDGEDVVVMTKEKYAQLTNTQPPYPDPDAVLAEPSIIPEPVYAPENHHPGYPTGLEITD